MSEARCWSSTPPYGAEGGQDVAAGLAPRGKGRLPVIAGIDVRLTHQLPGKLAEENAPHSPFDKNSH